MRDPSDRHELHLGGLLVWIWVLSQGLLDLASFLELHKLLAAISVS